jgi:hypothetical protein
MRSLLLGLVAAVSLLYACNNNRPATYTSKDGKDKITVDMKEVAAATDEMQKKADELKKLPPLTTDELKALLPQTLAGVTRTSFTANSMMGFSVGDAEYKINDTANLHLMVYDCAGEAGSAYYGLNYATRWNVESESEDGYTKSIEFNGGKAIESFEKYNSRYKLTFSGNDRLLVELDGQNVTLDMLKDAAKQLNMKVN